MCSPGICLLLSAPISSRTKMSVCKESGICQSHGLPCTAAPPGSEMFLGNYFPSGGIGNVPALVLHCPKHSQCAKALCLSSAFPLCGKMGVGGAGSEAIKAKFMVRENPALPSQLRVKNQGFIIASFSQVPLKAKMWEIWGGKKSLFSDQPGHPRRSQQT